jgi:hypothetical protein
VPQFSIPFRPIQVIPSGYQLIPHPGLMPGMYPAFVMNQHQQQSEHTTIQIGINQQISPMKSCKKKNGVIVFCKNELFFRFSLIYCSFTFSSLRLCPKTD